MRPLWAILAAVVSLIPAEGSTSPVDDRASLNGTDIEPERTQGGPYIPPGSTKAHPPARGAAALSLSAPLAHYTLSSGYGRRRDPFRKRPAFHAGLDLRAPMRSPVVASAPGVVVFAGWRAGYGRMVEVAHGDGVRTRYAHLARLSVGPGQYVARGRVVGLLGSSGRSTGPHLHYEVLVGGIPRDPRKFLAVGRIMPASVQR